MSRLVVIVVVVRAYYNTDVVRTQSVMRNQTDRRHRQSLGGQR